MWGGGVREGAKAEGGDSRQGTGEMRREAEEVGKRAEGREKSGRNGKSLLEKVSKKSERGEKRLSIRRGSEGMLLSRKRECGR